MDILVLDAIHGGQEIAAALAELGHRTDMVDVYRGQSGISISDALDREYDLMISPVHLDPAYPLLRLRSTPCITHHDAVRWILGDQVPEPFVEITGAQGKTTTAFALAHLMKGPGILHTSSGTIRYPDKALLWKKSITPASVISAARHAREIGGWCIAEVSLGLTGAGSLGILTSPLDYPCAGGMKRALDEKIRSVAHCKKVVAAPGIQVPYPWVHGVTGRTATDATSCSGKTGGTSWEFSSPLLTQESYRGPLLLAAEAAAFLNMNPVVLSSFRPLAGRMAVSREGRAYIIDNANSGTNAATTEEAVRVARNSAEGGDLTLVIGMDAHAVCEGFPPAEIARVIRSARPEHLVLVGDLAWEPAEETARDLGIPVLYAADLAAGRQIATARNEPGFVILAVKTWR